MKRKTHEKLFSCERLPRPSLGEAGRMKKIIDPVFVSVSMTVLKALEAEAASSSVFTDSVSQIRTYSFIDRNFEAMVRDFGV